MNTKLPQFGLALKLSITVLNAFLLVSILGPVNGFFQSSQAIVFSLAWSPDSTKIAVSRDSYVDIITASNGITLKTLTGANTLINSVDWSPDGTKLAAANAEYGNGLHVWDANSGLLITTQSVAGETVKWNQDNTRIAVTTISNEVAIWNTSTGQIVNSGAFGGAIDWNPNGTKLVSGSYDQSPLTITDITTGQPLLILSGHNKGVEDVDWSSDGAKIASGGSDNTVRTWNASTGAALQTFTGHTSIVTSVAWNSNGNMLASGSGDGTVRIWNIQTGQQVSIIQANGVVRTIAWSPDGSKLAFGGDSDILQISNAPGVATATSGPSLTPTSGPSPSSTSTPTVTPTSSSYSCPCSLWTTSDTPAISDSGNNAAIEVGVKFKSSVAGSITGLRFYKDSNNTGTHTGHLWTSSGNPLGTATFTGESASGWQTVNFSPPISISANTIYVASYHTTSGRFSYNSNYFTSAWVSGPLTALDDASSGGNGVYTLGPSGSFPTSSSSSPNAWVDVIFTTGGSSPTATNTPTRTPTATNTPTRTPTPTSGPSATPTRTPTATATSASGSFPTTGVLDTFNRSNGAIGGNWDGHTWTYSISSNQLLVDATADHPIAWNQASFGADQQAYFKFGAINSSATKINLNLKMQGTDETDAILEILYNPAGNKVQVYTYTAAQDWVQRGADISVTFAVGDVFGARAKADGTVEVYKNGTLVGSRSISAWPYYASGGKIGFGMYQAGGTIIDDFGGGNS